MWKLNTKKTVKFHHLGTIILFSIKRARLYTCTAVSFLPTRVIEPYNEKWSKLVHIMKYIRGTRNLPLISSANGSIILKWWIDGSFSVNTNMIRHTGGCLSMGIWFTIISSKKQKLNTWSSTETDIVAVDDFMPDILYNIHWMDAQGCDVFW